MRPEDEFICKVAFALGRLPWELDIPSVAHYEFLELAYEHGLIPDQWEIGWRIAATHNAVKREDFYPQFDRRSEIQKQKDTMSQLTSRATNLSHDLEL